MSVETGPVQDSIRFLEEAKQLGLRKLARIVGKEIGAD